MSDEVRSVQRLLVAVERFKEAAGNPLMDPHLTRARARQVVSLGVLVRFRVLLAQASPKRKKNDEQKKVVRGRSGRVFPPSRQPVAAGKRQPSEGPGKPQGNFGQDQSPRARLASASKPAARVAVTFAGRCGNCYRFS